MNNHNSVGGNSGGGNNGGGGNGGGPNPGNGMGVSCYTYPAEPLTEGLVNADIAFERGIYMNGSMTMDDENIISIWGFTDSANSAGGASTTGAFPSAPIRVTQGQIVHTILDNSMGMWLHTIHHHGIEPSTENDGVGHYSFDVDGIYIYQWIASHAGTYFYHCHTNTVLHAEMGMYGALIIDPPEGQGTLYSGGPTYDVEAIWACDEIDSSWHTTAMDWASGTCEGDFPGHNQLNPDYFIISGVDGARSALTNSSVATTVKIGESLLVRYICAGYLPQRITFGGLTATIHMSDGRILPNPVSITSIKASSAERYDCILKPENIGEYEVTVDTLDWVTGEVLGTARTKITVV